MALQLVRAGGLAFYQFPGLASFPGLVHAVFTSQGGVSPPPYASLNSSFSVGDDPERVRENRRRITAALHLEDLVSAAQVHGSNHHIITAPAPEEGPEFAEADILITRRPGLGLAIKQADCQAVMFYDPERRVVANVHCGWRGQVQNILGEAVKRLVEACGCRPEALHAAVGPGLGPCCAEFVNYRREFPPELWAYQVRPRYFDLWRLSRDQLIAAGLRPEHIEIAGLCTKCRGQEFFSYRRDGATGRQAAVIALVAG